MSITTDITNVYHFVHSKKCKSRTLGIMSYVSEPLRKQQDINCLAKHFQGVHQIGNRDGYATSSVNNMNNINISFNNVCHRRRNIKYNRIKKINNNITCGIDDVPKFIVKECWRIYSKHLYILFNLAIRTSTFPSIWENSRICPVHKIGSMFDISIGGARLLGRLCFRFAPGRSFPH